MEAIEQIEKVAKAVLSSNAWKGTLFISPKEVVRVTRRWYKGRNVSRQPIELTVSLTKPNYLERDQVKEFKKAGESFPVQKVQLKFKKQCV